MTRILNNPSGRCALLARDPRRIVGLLGFVMGCFFTSGPVARAQDLDSEEPLHDEVVFRHDAGLGPSLLECKLSEKGSLRCRTDRKLHSVDCKLDSLSLESKSPARVRVQGENFLCDRAPIPGLFSQVWHVFLWGEDGRLSEWTLEGASVEQQRLAYSAEMKAYGPIYRKGGWFDAYSLGPSVRMKALTGTETRSETFVGATADLKLWTSWSGFGTIDWKLGSSDAHKRDAEFGLRFEPKKIWHLIPHLAFSMAWRGHTGLDDLIYENAFEGGVDFSMLRDRVRVGPVAAALWPLMDRTRADSWAGLNLRIGPWFGHWGLKVIGAYVKEVWEHQSVSQNDSGIETRVSLFWLSDDWPR